MERDDCALAVIINATWFVWLTNEIVRSSSDEERTLARQTGLTQHLSLVHHFTQVLKGAATANNRSSTKAGKEHKRLPHTATRFLPMCARERGRESVHALVNDAIDEFLDVRPIRQHAHERLNHFVPAMTQTLHAEREKKQKTKTKNRQKHQPLLASRRQKRTHRKHRRLTFANSSSRFCFACSSSPVILDGAR